MVGKVALCASPAAMKPCWPASSSRPVTRAAAKAAGFFGQISSAVGDLPGVQRRTHRRDDAHRLPDDAAARPGPDRRPPSCCCTCSSMSSAFLASRRKQGATFLLTFAARTAGRRRLIVSAYMLWSFGRFDGAGLQDAATMIVVLGFPAAIGAASAAAWWSDGPSSPQARRQGRCRHLAADAPAGMDRRGDRPCARGRGHRRHKGMGVLALQGRRPHRRPGLEQVEKVEQGYVVTLTARSRAARRPGHRRGRAVWGAKADSGDHLRLHPGQSTRRGSCSSTATAPGPAEDTRQGFRRA